jgi:hypothetical protein
MTKGQKAEAKLIRDKKHEEIMDELDDQEAELL